MPGKKKRKATTRKKQPKTKKAQKVSPEMLRPVSVSQKLVQRVIKTYSDNANHARAIKMKQYLRNQFEFYGIQTPARKLLDKEILNEQKIIKGKVTKKIEEDAKKDIIKFFSTKSNTTRIR